MKSRNFEILRGGWLELASLGSFFDISNRAPMLTPRLGAAQGRRETGATKL
jgi:hypothetical protein